MASTRYKGFIGPSYLLRNTRYDAQRTINLYPEVDESGLGKAAEVSQLTRTAGLTQLVQADGKAGKSVYLSSTGMCFAVKEDGLYLIEGVDGSTTGWTSVKKASFVPNDGVICTDDGISLFVTSAGKGWSIDLTTYALTEITTFAPSSCAFIDGSIVFSEYNTNKFYWTELYSTVVNTLNFASAEANPDMVVGVFNNNMDLWVFGRRTTEIWYDSGPTAASGIGSNTVFSRRQGILVETGCVAPATICKMNKNRIMWLSRDDRGGPTVVMAEGFVVQRISTFAIEQKWSNLSEAQLLGATAYAYNQDGHLFYCLNIPGVQSTWVFDGTTSEQLQQSIWHERTYANPLTGVQSRHLAEGHAMYLNKHVVLDYVDGAVYFLDQDAYTDAGDKIYRTRVAPHISNDGKRLFYNWLQLDVKTGIGLATGDFLNPKVMLEFSDDGGVTWSNIIECEAGVLGDYKNRVIFHRLGQSRDRVFRVTMTDPVDWCLSGAAIDLQPGEW